MMNREDILNLMKQEGIQFECYEHPAAFTVEQAESLNIPHEEDGAKNLFLRDDKKRNFYLITCRYETKVNLKEVRAKIQSRSLQFASEEMLMDILGLEKGSVTPFGLLNDAERKVHFYLDDTYLGGNICCHPMKNTATVYMKVDDLIQLLSTSGVEVNYITL